MKLVKNIAGIIGGILISGLSFRGCNDFQKQRDELFQSVPGVEQVYITQNKLRDLDLSINQELVCRDPLISRYECLMSKKEVAEAKARAETIDFYRCLLGASCFVGSLVSLGGAYSLLKRIF